VDVVYRPAGDHYLLVEYGPLVLDINLRFRVHALMNWINQHRIEGIHELTPGIRSLQIHYDSQQCSVHRLLDYLGEAEAELTNLEDHTVPARIVHLPLSWNDEACQLAIQKYMQSVRKDAPWCPSNLEFIRRINGLESIDDVKRIVFEASYVVMGLGDVYLGAPVATPLDPRHRLVTTKYNPARTWTAENSVGIGGSYLCIYGMEGPGGYQFVGRTLQMWNRYRQTTEFTQPWLLRFFDQVRFYEVSADELLNIRKAFPKGQYPIKIEQTEFSLQAYNQYLADNQQAIAAFTQKRQQAFDAELQRWIDSGQINFESEQHVADDPALEESLAEHEVAIESHVAGNIWKLLVKPGDEVKTGDPVLVLESMKMEIEVLASEPGRINRIIKEEGSQVSAGQRLMVMELSDK
jgi:urea carboxylase